MISFNNIFDQYESSPFNQTIASTISNAISRLYNNQYDKSLIKSKADDLEDVVCFSESWGINIKAVKITRAVKEKRNPFSQKRTSEIIKELFDFKECTKINYSIVKSNEENIDHKLISLHSSDGRIKRFFMEDFQSKLSKKNILFETLNNKESEWYREKNKKKIKEDSLERIFEILDDDQNVHFGQIGLYKKEQERHFKTILETNISNNNVFQVIENQTTKSNDQADFILEYTGKTLHKLLGDYFLDLNLPIVSHSTECDDFSSEHINAFRDSPICSYCNSSIIPVLGLNDPWIDHCCSHSPATVESGQFEINEEETAIISKIVCVIHGNIKKGVYS